MRALALTALAVLGTATIGFGAYRPGTIGPATTLAASILAEPSTGGCEAPPSLSHAIYSDIAGHNSQANVNCLAWQDFIAVNWQASLTTCAADTTAPASEFGRANNTRPVVWETYKEASDVFQKGGIRPSPWCSAKQTSGTSKVLGSSFVQAGTKGAWLTGQNHHVVFYEKRINRDVFSYIEGNQLYDASNQATFAASVGIDLPDGTATYSQYGKDGSMIFKAAWIELPDPSQWIYFKTSKAYVIDPGSNGQPRLATMGLVGLHIIHKTAKSPQFVWATFEHVRNAPSASDIRNKRLLDWYTFYNAGCSSQTDHYHCSANAQPAGATPAHPMFPRPLTDPYDAPMQVVRENSISDTTFNNIAGLNQWVWNLIRNRNPHSVFLNYQAVDVLWADVPARNPPGAEIPLTAGNPQPNPATRKVANTTVETYFQNTSTCLDCHASAAIASADGPKRIASDYSFLFGGADNPFAGELNSK
jgi:hypothetical protein